MMYRIFRTIKVRLKCFNLLKKSTVYLMYDFELIISGDKTAFLREQSKMVTVGGQKEKEV